MFTEKTKDILSVILGIISIVLLFGGTACDIISHNWPDMLPKSDWYEVMIFVGWPFLMFAEYFRLIFTKQEVGKVGWNVFFDIIIIGFVCIRELFDINHFTAPIVAVLSIFAILAILGCILNYRKWLDIKAQFEAQENEKNPK